MATNYVFILPDCNDVDETYNELKNVGANIVGDIEDKTWGIRQFTLQDQDGNVFYFHHG